MKPAKSQQLKIFLRESKDRSHRRLDRSEATFTTESEIKEDIQKELQTTSRFELQSEVTSLARQNGLSIQLSASASGGKYGPVQWSTNGGIAYHKSQSDSQRSARNFSKDLVERAATNIQKSVKEQRTSKIISEVEEINKHGFNNKGGSQNVCGIYCWLDKQYQAQVYNYGKRLMFEFIIPEPASFMKKIVDLEKEGIEPIGDVPDAPEKPDIKLGDTSYDTISKYAKIYEINTSGLEGKPEDTVVSVGCIKFGNEPNQRELSGSIDDGYAVDSIILTGWSRGNLDAEFVVAVGGSKFTLKDSSESKDYKEYPATAQGIHHVEKTLPVSIYSAGMDSYSLQIIGTAYPKTSKEMDWQAKAYGLIMDGYNKKLGEYKSKLSEYEAKKESYDNAQKAFAQGFNPKINNDIIKSELKKHCITMISKQFGCDKYKINDILFGTTLATKEYTDSAGKTKNIPAIDIDAARENRKNCAIPRTSI